MSVILKDSGIQFPDGFLQSVAAKSYTQQRYTSSSNIGATTVSFTSIPTDSKSIIILASSLSFSSGPNTPKVEIWSGSTLNQGYYRSYQNLNYNYMGTVTYSNSNWAAGYSNLLYLPSYSEAANFIIELNRVPSTSNVTYNYTFAVNTNYSTGNQTIGHGTIYTSNGSYIGFDKVVVGNGSAYNIVTSDISVFYK